MSDSTQPATSRRALREKRRAEMQAQLANSQAEQEAHKAALLSGQLEAAGQSEDTSAPKPAATPAKPVPKPGPRRPAGASAASAGGRSTGTRSTANRTSGTKRTGKKPTGNGTSAGKPAGNRPAPQKSPVRPAPAKRATGTQGAAGKPVKPVNGPAQPADAGAKPAAGSVPSERESLRRARDRETQRERRRLQDEVSALSADAPTVEPGAEPKPLTRRQLRVQAQEQQQAKHSGVQRKPVPQSSKPAMDGRPNTETTVMSVEEALAARRRLAPKPPVDPNLLAAGDKDLDLGVLAHQREMAARAAVISRRAAERERLRQDNEKAGRESASPDPFTGAMGSIRELEDKIARSGVSGPKTSSVSLELDASGKVRPAGTKSAGKPSPAPAASKPAAKPAPKATAKTVTRPAAQPSPAKPAGKPAAKVTAKPATTTPAKSSTATAPAASGPDARNVDVVDLPRVQAVQAQGLQPLDANTAGMRRANNRFLAMIAALAIGGIALVVGLIMILGN